MTPHDRVRLRHIADALSKAIAFAQSRERKDLETDDMLSMALVQAITIVGEAASKVSTETRAAIPDVPWASLIGMRNRLVHAYFDIDQDILWATVTDAAPPVLRQILRALEPE